MIVTKCPQCGQRLQVDAKYLGQKGRCTSCQSIFEITEAPPDPPADFQAVETTVPSSAPAPPPVPQTAMCVQHPQAPSVGNCDFCNAPFCNACREILTSGRQVCRNCYPTYEELAPAPQSAPVPAFEDAWGRPQAYGLQQSQPDRPPAPERGYSSYGNCSNHPSMAAVAECTKCYTPVCATCQFTFPGGLVLCPACATAPQPSMSGKRKGLLVLSYVMAVVASLGIAFVFITATSAPVANRQQEDMLGLLFTFLVFIPSLVGTAVGFSCFDRNLSNPPIIWGAVIWNGLILAAFIMLSIVGIMMGP